MIVFSLHGMGPNTSQFHFLPEMLDRINVRFDPPADGLAPRPQRSVMRLLRERLPATLQEAIARRVPESARDWVTSRAFGTGIDWERAPGFVLPSGGETLLRCNLVGRERRGALIDGSQAHQRYLESVKDTLLALRVADTGAPWSGRWPSPRRTSTGPPPPAAGRRGGLE